MKIQTIKRIFLTAAAIVAVAVITDAQERSTSTLTRRTPGRERKTTQQNEGPRITDRMQAFYDEDGSTITDADRQWMRIVYRHLDLDLDKNAPLYFPEDIVDGQENLFRIIMRLLANNQIKAYEYLDGREIFNEENEVKVGEMLDRFSIMHTDAKGSTAKNPRYTIHPSDIPTNEVLSYYIIEQWEFDTRSNKTHAVVKAICPVLHREGDFGGEAARYPMFWIKFSDIRPWLAQQYIFVDDSNNLPTATYDDFFTLNMYEGDIYKTRNLKNKSMAQLYPDPNDMKRAQDSIQAQLENFDKKLWVPNREDLIADKDKTSKKSDKDAEAVGEATDTNNTEIAEATEEKAPKRATKRSSKKPKKSKVKESKVKSSKSSSAVRSVRRRK